MAKFSQVESLLTNLYNLRKNVKLELRYAGDDRLMISKNSCGIMYFRVRVKDGVRDLKGIGTNKESVYRLAHIEYLRRYLRVIENNIAVLEKIHNKFAEDSPDDIFKLLPKNYDLLSKEYILNPNLLSSESRCHRPMTDGTYKPVALPRHISGIHHVDWMYMPYCANTSFPEHKHHTCGNGLMARSKSEVSIIALYDSKAIPYHYDETALLADGRFISPDFIGLRRDGSVVVHEHLGMMNDPEYKRIFYNKLEVYKQEGFEMGNNLLLTFDDETGGINIPLISALIDDIYRIGQSVNF